MMYIIDLEFFQMKDSVFSSVAHCAFLCVAL